jgi:hypothetical protein
MSDTNWKKVAQEAEKVRDLVLEARHKTTLARHKAEQERDQAHERAAHLSVELAAMTLSRDQARQEADQLRRQVEAVIDEVAWSYCPPNATCVFKGEDRCIKCWSAWAAQQAKEGGK